jgi:hypothetical protein
LVADEKVKSVRALSLGNSTPGEIASYISGFIERGLRSQDVKSYLANLLRMGIANRTQLADRKRYLYSIESPLIDLFYYLDTKLGYYEVDVPMEELENSPLSRKGLISRDFWWISLPPSTGRECRGPPILR